MGEGDVERREFVKTAIAAGAGFSVEAAAMGQTGVAQAEKREFYQLRKYTLRNGPQMALCQNYFEHALIPALGRMGIGPVGAFRLDIGPETPTFYVLIPSTDLQGLADLDARLGADAEYIKAAAGFRDAPATAPAFERAERSLLGAFAGWPKLTAAKKVDGKLPKRIFQLRTYESPSQTTHLRKIAMFNEAEIALFVKHGLNPVFFADTLIGTRMPSLIYMLTFADMAECTANWAAFGSDPEWHELSRRPGNTDPEIVSNISNLYLSPLSCSQI